MNYNNLRQKPYINMNVMHRVSIMGPAQSSSLRVMGLNGTEIDPVEEYSYVN